jgi:hypothetical protein
MYCVLSSTVRTVLLYPLASPHLVYMPAPSSCTFTLSYSSPQCSGILLVLLHGNSNNRQTRSDNFRAHVEVHLQIHCLPKSSNRPCLPTLRYVISGCRTQQQQQHKHDKHWPNRAASATHTTAAGTDARDLLASSHPSQRNHDLWPWRYVRLESYLHLCFRAFCIRRVNLCLYRCCTFKL